MFFEKDFEPDITFLAFSQPHSIFLNSFFVNSWDNKCASEPCENGGACFDIGDKYFCACLNGFKGDQCEVDISKESKSLTITKNTNASTQLCSQSICQNGGSCYANETMFYCECQEGFEGKNCEKKRKFACCTSHITFKNNIMNQAFFEYIKCKEIFSIFTPFKIWVSRTKRILHAKWFLLKTTCNNRTPLPDKGTSRGGVQFFE